MKNIQPVIAFGFPLLLSVALLPSFALQPESASAEVREIPAETTLQPSSETGVEEASSSSTSSDAPFASETQATNNPQTSPDAELYAIQVESISGEKLSLGAYKGQALMIVNTASNCGFTPQYKELQELYERYQAKGFRVLGFPSNDFGSQEPGSNEEIKQFCSEKFGVSFPLFAKAPVSGPEKHPLYRYLTEQSGPDFKGEIGWNFEKFIIGRDGTVRARFGSFATPLSARVIESLEKVITEQSPSS